MTGSFYIIFIRHEIRIPPKKTPTRVYSGMVCQGFVSTATWSIIPFSERLVILVNKSPIPGVVGFFPNGLY